ncbi:MAG: SagB/ThcOx family dehydrogenase [Bacillota bacterium]
MEKVVQDFIKSTYPENSSPSAHSQEIPPPPRLNLPDNIIDSFELLSPEEFDLPDTDLFEIMKNRRSRRAYASHDLNLNELSILLYYTQGIKKELSQGRSFRLVPSAGARHPYDTYIYLNQVQTLPQGLYYYNPEEHRLDLVIKEDLTDKLITATMDQKFIGDASALFLWVGDYYRTSWRYSERAYRYINLDGGHICQNLYLAAEALNLGVCAIAAYDDNKINNFMGLDGEDKAVLYMASLGGQKK